jgi:hypothetical protein
VSECDVAAFHELMASLHGQNNGGASAATLEDCAMRCFHGNAGATNLGLHLGQQNVTLDTSTRCPKLQ